MSLNYPCYPFLSGALTGLHGKRYRVAYTNSKLLVWSFRAAEEAELIILRNDFTVFIIK